MDEAKKNITQGYPATKFHTFPTSIGDAKRVSSVFADIRAHITEPDVAVLNAARGYSPAPTLSVPIDSLFADFEINVRGHLNVVTEFLHPETLVKEKKIVNVSTTGAHQRIPCMAGYGASKEAFMHISMHLQEEYADKDVHITSYHPCTILTSRVKANGFDKYPITWGDTEWLFCPIFACLSNVNILVQSHLQASLLFGLHPKRPTSRLVDSSTRAGTSMSLKRGRRKSKAATFSKLDSLVSLRSEQMRRN